MIFELEVFVRVYLLGYIFCIINCHICWNIFGRIDIMYYRLSYIFRCVFPLKTLILYIYWSRGIIQYNQQLYATGDTWWPRRHMVALKLPYAGRRVLEPRWHVAAPELPWAGRRVPLHWPLFRTLSWAVRVWHCPDQAVAASTWSPPYSGCCPPLHDFDDHDHLDIKGLSSACGTRQFMLQSQHTRHHDAATAGEVNSSDFTFDLFFSLTVCGAPTVTVRNVRVYLIGYIFCIIECYICRDIFDRIDIIYCRLPCVSRCVFLLKTLVFYIYR
jgi:hypothetical protein